MWGRYYHHQKLLKHGLKHHLVSRRRKVNSLVVDTNSRYYQKMDLNIFVCRRWEVILLVIYSISRNYLVSFNHPHPLMLYWYIHLFPLILYAHRYPLILHTWYTHTLLLSAQKNERFHGGWVHVTKPKCTKNVENKMNTNRIRSRPHLSLGPVYAHCILVVSGSRIRHPWDSRFKASTRPSTWYI